MIGVPIKTKLYMPTVRRKVVPRRRLVEKLDEGLLDGHHLTLISAPAGSGKTTLLSEWLTERQLRTAWLSLDKNDNDLSQFWFYVVAALQTVQPDIGQAVLQYLQSPQPPPVQWLLPDLLNEIAALPEQVVLVIDDYELISAPEIHESVEFVLDHLPDKLHLVVSTRSDPPLPIARLRARNQVTELRSEDLRFRLDEAAVFMSEVMRLNLAPADLAVLDARTEGWIAGLQLAALSMHGRPDLSGFIEAFAGTERLVLDYLIEQVLARQSETIQGFLLQTSILDRLTAPLCNALTGRIDSQSVLEQLEHANLFIVPLDDERKWFRYHHLFAGALRSRFCQEQPEAVREVYRSASAWYEQEGLTAEAVETALAGQDFERAALLIETGFESMYTHAETAAPLAWLQALPPELLRSRPRLSIIKAHALVTLYRFRDAELCLEDLENAMPPPETALQGKSETSRILGESAVIRSAIAILENQPERGIELYRRALELLPADHGFLHGLISLGLGMAYMATGDLRAARLALTEAMRSHNNTSNPLLYYFPRYYLAEVEIVEGNLRAAAEALREALKSATTPRGTYLPIAIFSHIRLSSLLYQWNDLETAVHEANLGIDIDLSKGWWRRDMMVEAYVTLARCQQAQGKSAAALSSVRQAEETAEGKYQVQLVAHVATSHLRLWMQEGCLQSSIQMASSLEQTLRNEADIRPEKQDEALAAARVLVAQARFESAERLLKPFLRLAERSGFKRRATEALVLQSLASYGQGNSTRALVALSGALSLAQVEGYIRIFVDEGAPMLTLLKRAKAQGVTPAYVEQLLAAFGESTDVGYVSAALPAEPLSGREVEILRLIAAGRSPQEISDQLGITVGTARTHTKKIYHKLNVHSRWQAIQRAHELNLY